MHVHSPLSSSQAQQELFAIDDNKDYVTNPGSEMPHDIPSVLGFRAEHANDPNLIISAIGKISTKHSKMVK